MASRYIALIPAYEPDRKLLGVVADLGKRGFDIVVVDDGSGPEYAEVFEQALERLPGKTGSGVRLLIHDVNKGKGAALKTGLDFISNFMIVKGEENDCVVVTVDADGQHLGGDASRVARKASGQPGTLVLGSRRLGKSDIPLRSRFGNSVTRDVFRLATGTHVYDTQTGLRAFTADLIPELLKIRGDRYEYEINMLMEFAGKGIPVEEVEIETIYLDGNSSSHFNAVRDSFRIYREIGSYALSGRAIFQAAKFSASSLISFLVDYAVYALLLLAGPGLVFANIGARLVSSAVNFTINRRLVFRSDGSALRSAIRYFALAAIILAGNTFVLKTLVGTLGVGRMTAKIFTEILFFIISWTVQKYVVFYSTPDEEGRNAGTARIPDRFLIEYAAVRPGKLKGVRRRRAGNA